MSWYRTGTISIPSGSKAVTGNGTTFNDTAAGINPGDMIIVGGQFLEVATVNSATSITTVNASTAAVTNAAYQIVTTVQMSNATLAKKVAAAMDRIINGISNWMLIFKGSGDVTITNYDGSTATGKAWPTMSQMVTDSATALAGKANTAGQVFTGPVKANAGLTAGPGTEIDRIYLGGKTEITGDLINKGQTVKTLAYQDQIDRTDLNAELSNNLFAAGSRPNTQGAGVFYFNNTPFGYGEQYGLCMQMNNRTDTSGAAGSGIWQHYLALCTSGNIIYATNVNGSYSARKLYTTSNTTTNSSGALVPASPVVRIVNSRGTATRTDLRGVDNAEYTWATDYNLCNGESEGCVVSRVGTGTYLIKGALGLAKDLWTVMDCGNGQGRILALAEAEETVDGVVVRCHKQKYTINEDGDLTVDKGALMDVPAESWIDVRLEMPADSICNESQKNMDATVKAYQEQLMKEQEAAEAQKAADEASEAEKNSMKSVPDVYELVQDGSTLSDSQEA